MVVLLATGG
jgi:target of rapamycin complex subunit LST8